jgi:hypothetical protein
VVVIVGVPSTKRTRLSLVTLLNALALSLTVWLTLVLVLSLAAADPSPHAGRRGEHLR